MENVLLPYLKKLAVIETDHYILLETCRQINEKLKTSRTKRYYEEYIRMPIEPEYIKPSCHIPPVYTKPEKKPFVPNKEIPDGVLVVLYYIFWPLLLLGLAFAYIKFQQNPVLTVTGIVGLIVLVVFLWMQVLKKEKRQKQEAEEAYQRQVAEAEAEYAEKLRKYNEEYEERVRKYDEEYNRKYQEYQRKSEEYQRAVKESNARRMRSEERELRYQRTLENMLSELGEQVRMLNKTREKAYEAGIVYPKYQGLIPIVMFCEYIESGRCNTLTGHEGAYNIYESDMKYHNIVTRLDRIQSSLDEIRMNQQTLYNVMEEANFRIDNLVKSYGEQNSLMQNQNRILQDSSEMMMELEKEKIDRIQHLEDIGREIMAEQRWNNR